jgi:large repetitive protein
LRFPAPGLAGRRASVRPAYRLAMCYRIRPLSPLNSVVVATFDQAIASGANTDNFYLLVNNSGSPVVGGSVNQIAPNMLELIPGMLAPNTYYYVHLTGIQNVNGLGLNVGSSSYFYTGGAADSTAPVVNSVAPTNGATNIGGNAILEFTFNEVVDTYTINAGTVTLTANGNPVPFTLSFGGSYNYNNPGTSVSLTPEIPLPDSASVTLKISVGGTILNLAGNAVPEVDVTFTTGPGPDFTAPYIVSESPNYNGPGPQQNYIQTNSTFVFVFNEPLSPNSVLNNPNVSLYNVGTSSYIPAGVSLSPDGTTITFSPGPLTAGVQYRPCMYNIYNLAANFWNGTCAYFTTAAGGSATPQVIYTTPINGATNVPTNGLIEIAFNELISGRSLGQILLTPTSPAGAAMPVTASLVFDSTVVRITPASLLTPNTTYQLSIAGVTDFSGANAVTSQTIGFTTGINPQIGNSSTSFTAANVMVYNGTSTQLPNYTNPGVTNVDGTQPITLTFSGPIEEASLFGGYAVRLYTTLGGPSTSVPFTFALSNGGSTVAIVPNSALASGTEYTLTVNYNGTIYDQAGYAVANGPYFYFTTH